MVSQNVARCRHGNMERTPDTHPVWRKILICRHRARLQTQSRALQTAASCVSASAPAAHGICWKVARGDGDLPSRNAPLRRGAGLPRLFPHQHLRRLRLKSPPVFCCSSRQAAAALRAPVLCLCAVSARLVHLWYCSASAARHTPGLLSISRVLEPGFRRHISLTVTRSVRVVRFLPSSS